MGQKLRKERRPGPLEAHVDNLEAQLDLWATQIDGLTALAEKSVPRGTTDCRRSIYALRAKCAVAQAKVEEFKAAGTEKVDGFKAGIERAWRDLVLSVSDLKI